MQDASGIDLQPFMGWYDQAGTPEVTTDDPYDPAARRCTLTASATTPPTPGPAGQASRAHSASRWAARTGSGAGRRPGLTGENAAQPGTRLLLLEGAEQSFVFEDVPAPPVPSLLRGFSAPVRLRGCRATGCASSRCMTPTPSSAGNPGCNTPPR